MLHIPGGVAWYEKRSSLLIHLGKTDYSFCLMRYYTFFGSHVAFFYHQVFFCVSTSQLKPLKSILMIPLRIPYHRFLGNNSHKQPHVWVNLNGSVICIHSETEATMCFPLKCINSMDCLPLGVSAEGRYLYFDLDVLSRCYQLIQCLLGVLHVAAVLPVDQQPGEGYKATTFVNLNTLPPACSPA